MAYHLAVQEELVHVPFQGEQVAAYLSVHQEQEEVGHLLDH